MQSGFEALLIDGRYKISRGGTSEMAKIAFVHNITSHTRK